ncbi:MAG: glycosyltransferase family 2 protein [bacterium]|nr:glycosyltransferase family 2 protein [bacterium]
MKISATIITFNEQTNIARAIESLRCCDEVVVVDRGSVDRTVEIAKELGAKVVENPWEGFASQKNVAAREATHDWVFSIDADESLSEALEGEIWQLKKSGPSHDAYTMPRLAQYLGRWILHSGWYPDRKIRLYDRRKCTWVGNYVHESVKVSGSVGHLEANLLHYTCDSLFEHLETMNRYTTLAAEQLVAENVHIGWRHLLLDPIWTFLKTYFLKRGFLDGTEGLAIAYMASLYNFVKYAKARFMNPTG